MPIAYPCASCGRLSASKTRCPACQREADQASPYQTHAWRKRSREVVERDGECVVCGSDHRLSAHHVENRNAGGSDDASNLLTLCVGCHVQLEADLRGERETDLVLTVRQVAEGVAEADIWFG